MRKALLVRVRPLVERFANQLTEIVVARMEAEFARVNDSLEVALSAYQSDGAPDLQTAENIIGKMLLAKYAVNPPAKRRASKLPVKGSTSGAPARADAAESKSVVDAPVSEAVSKRGAPRESGKGDYLEREKRTEPQSQVKTCSKCGFVGGNARGCGTAHATQQPGEADPAAPVVIALTAKGSEAFGEVSKIATAAAGWIAREKNAQPMTAIAPDRRLSPTPGAIAAAKARIARISSRAKTTPPSARRPEPAAEVDDNENADERWSPQRMAEEREIAENRKHAGELPQPRSSFRVTPSRGGYDTHGDLGDVQELDFGASD